MLGTSMGVSRGYPGRVGGAGRIPYSLNRLEIERARSPPVSARTVSTPRELLGAATFRFEGRRPVAQHASKRNSRYDVLSASYQGAGRVLRFLRFRWIGLYSYMIFTRGHSYVRPRSSEACRSVSRGLVTTCPTVVPYMPCLPRIPRAWRSPPEKTNVINRQAEIPGIAIVK